MRDRPVISIENYTIYCGDADENKVDAPHAPTETTEDNSKDAFFDELNALMSKIPSQQVVIVGIDAKDGTRTAIRCARKMVLCSGAHGDRLVDLCEQTGLIIASTFKRNHRRHQLTLQGSTLLTPEEQRKRKMRTLKLQLDYALARNIPQTDAARETLPVLLPRKKFAFASAETKSTYNSVCDARSAGDFNQEKRLRRKLCRQLQQDRDNEWTSRAMEFEKAWGDRNPRKTYALLKQYSGKMKTCSPVLYTANGVAVGEATLPIWKEHFKTLLKRLAPSAPELEHVHRPTYAVNEEPPTVSKVLVCIQKMKNGKSGEDDGISAEMLKYLPPSGIREMTKIIRSIWIDERIPDSWRHTIIIPLHKKLSVTDPRNYRGISLLRVMYKVLERIILDRLIKHREEKTRDEQAGFRPGWSTIDQVFIVRRVIEIWVRYSKPMQLAFLDFEAAFDSPHRDRLLNALSADGVPGKFVRLLDDMNQRTTAAVRTPAGCTTPFEVVTGVRQGAVAGPFLFNFAIELCEEQSTSVLPTLSWHHLGATLLTSSTPTMLYSRKAVRNFNMLSTLYRSWLQPMDYAYALINASRCGSLRDHERESGWTDNR
ncbi:hypothetical protein RB195_010892 [Necator americanus]|uniref:Reverse transcriptase domain-containing protein n=1 Tax=Necator americanus TaxID=51031 RepID=A0ABR1D174_NECAM